MWNSWDNLQDNRQTWLWSTIPFGKLTVCHRKITQKWFILLIGKLKTNIYIYMYIWAVFPRANNQRVRNNQKWGMVRTCLLMIHRFSIYMSHAKGNSVKNHLHVRSSCWTWQFFIGIFSQRGVSENRGFKLSSKANSLILFIECCVFLGFPYIFRYFQRTIQFIHQIFGGFPMVFPTFSDNHWRVRESPRPARATCRVLIPSQLLMLSKAARATTRREPETAGGVLWMVTSVSNKWYTYTWLVVWNIFLPFSWDFHHPNWRTPSFFRGVGIPPTSIVYPLVLKNVAMENMWKSMENPRTKWRFQWKSSIALLDYRRVGIILFWIDRICKCHEVSSTFNS